MEDTVVIKVNTGFVAGIHEEDTGMTLEEWNDLSEKDKMGICQEVLNEYCEAYPEMSSGEEVEF